MTTDIPLGSRVVLRYRLPAGSTHPMTDVIGQLVTLDPLTVRDSNGHEISVDASRVVALKALAARPIRTSEIRAVEYAAADGWPGLEREWLDGWLLRFGQGFTGRANSAVPLDESASLMSLDRIASWFAERGQTPQLLIPDRLGTVPPGWCTWDEVLVLAADIESLGLPTGRSIVRVDVLPSPAWLSLYRYRGTVPPPAAVDLLRAVHDGVVGFGSIGDPAGEALAIARAAVTKAPDGRRWVGLTAVEVAEQHRRHGIGTLICTDLVRWGYDRGATHAYLQVAADNEPAIAMYRGLGFVEHHRYRYAAPCA